MSAKKKKKPVLESKWVWYGNPGHFICSHLCRFHLCTKVGKYLVSTVGQMWPSRSSREIHAEVYDINWLIANRHLQGDEFDFAYMKKFGYEEIGCDRKFETMVFKAGKECDRKGCDCRLPEHASDELDFLSYNDAISATAGHMKLCRKWASR